MNMFEVWLLLVFLPNLNVLAVPALFLSLLWVVLCALWWGMNAEDVQDEAKISKYKELGYWDKSDEMKHQLVLNNLIKAKSCVKAGLIASICSALICAAVPDRKEMIAIAVIPYVSNNAEFKKLPENLIGTLNDLIEEYRGKKSSH